MDIFGAKRDMSKRDVSVRLGKAYDKEDEVKYIWEQAKNATSEGYSAVTLLPKHEYIVEFANILLKNNNKPKWNYQEDSWGKPDYKALNSHFASNGMKVEYVGNGYGSFQNAEKNRNLILMTYHSAKGMDFDNVFLPFLSDDLEIARNNPETLLMVALTRSKMNLFLTYSGFLHSLVKKFEATCQTIPLNKASNEKASDINFDF
jgi:superfamily I DNA/RNA helicase